VQSALLEAMQERQVTIGDQTYRLDAPFMVLATQNPIEQEGTYPLPEAQVDRFMLKVIITYPVRAEERAILQRMTGEPLPPVKPVVTPAQILHAREAARGIYIDAKIQEYVLDLVFATREPAAHGLDDLRSLIAYGASPRATIYLITAAKAHAFLQGRGYVIPEDIKQVALDVLQHRVIVTYEAEAEGVNSADIVRQILDHVQVP
jgi:MoxR-like ATPase